MRVSDHPASKRAPVTRDPDEWEAPDTPPRDEAATAEAQEPTWDAIDTCPLDGNDVTVRYAGVQDFPGDLRSVRTVRFTRGRLFNRTTCRWEQGGRFIPTDRMDIPLPAAAPVAWLNPHPPEMAA